MLKTSFIFIKKNILFTSVQGQQPFIRNGLVLLSMHLKKACYKIKFY